MKKRLEKMQVIVDKIQLMNVSDDTKNNALLLMNEAYREYYIYYKEPMILTYTTPAILKNNLIDSIV